MLTRDGTAEPVSRDQILRRERGQGNIHFSCSADHLQDWQPDPVDPYSCCMCDHTYIIVVARITSYAYPNYYFIVIIEHILMYCTYRERLLVSLQEHDIIYIITAY